MYHYVGYTDVPCYENWDFLQVTDSPLYYREFTGTWPHQKGLTQCKRCYVEDIAVNCLRQKMDEISYDYLSDENRT